VRKALSGVARMSRRIHGHEWEARYGRDRIIKCLLGSRAKPITDAGLHELTTWGALSNCSPDFVSDLFDQLARQGLLQITDGDYPLLQLTDYGSRVMFGEILPELAWPNPDGGLVKDLDSGEVIGVLDDALYRTLVHKRNELARARNNAPAYSIFPNTVLKQLATRKPATEAEAMTIKGIGPAKAKSILPTFLKLIASHEAAGGRFHLD
jgi:ATP-dependent DNA helicase RecQ